VKFQYNPPVIIQKLFPAFRWESRVRKILLTFDDGPVPGLTETILKKLGDNKIKGLFFCVGSNVRKSPLLVQEIINEGHTIGCHTYNHTNLTSPDFNPIVEIDGFNRLVFDKFGVEVKYFRPPHGRFNLYTNKILKEREMVNVMWSLLTYDFKGDLAKVKMSVSWCMRDNSIIVLHDNLKSQNIISDSIDYIVREAAGKGFSFGEPVECLN
jgi:peptidoglycan/xylan/chitin deacetylase (PgdA/CDA1 family)